MRRDAMYAPLRALLCGLLVMACGGTETEPALPEELLGTQQAELCAGLYVTSLAISGASTYDGLMAASGTWTVSPGANAVRLEYYVDDVLYTAEERVGATGTWYFSTTGITCGPRNLVVKTWPMVVDSAGNRTTCSAASSSTSMVVTEDCNWALYITMPCGSFPYPSCPGLPKCPSSPAGQVCSPYGNLCLFKRSSFLSDIYACR